MSKLRNSQISSFDPSQRAMDAHQKKFAVSEAEAAALRPDLHEDPQKMDAHAARLDFSEEETSNFNEQYTANIDEEIKKDEAAIAHQKKVIERMQDMNAAFDTQQQIKVDKKIAKEGYDKASETGALKEGKMHKGAKIIGEAMAASADLVTGTLQRGDKGELSKMSAEYWQTEHDRAMGQDVSEANIQADLEEQARKDKEIVDAGFDDEAIDEKLVKKQDWQTMYHGTKNLSNAEVTAANQQSDAQEQISIDEQIADAGFDEASVERKLAKQEKGGLLKRIGRWFGIK